jgi:hypothetical protein
MATYYVSDTTGSDLDDGLSEGDAFKTIQQAIDTVAAGDQVYVKADGTYTEALTAPVVGTAADPIHFEGYTTTTGDGGLVTNDGTGTLGVGLTYAVNQNWYHTWTNFRFTDFTSHGMTFGLGSSLMIRACESDNNGGTGIVVKDISHIVNCHVHNNTGGGVSCDGQCSVIGCLIRNNGTPQIGMTGVRNYVYNNVVTATTGLGIQLVNGNNFVIGNTVWGDNKQMDYGIVLTSGIAVPNIVINNIVSECAIVGIYSNDGAGDLWTSHVAILHNLLFDNTDNYFDASTAIGEVTADPQFNNTGAGDFTLAAGSPAVNVGAHPATVPNAPTQDGNTHYLGAVSIKAGLIAADYPAVGDVEKGVAFNFGASTGTFKAPAVGDVETGVQYGAGDTEFTGTFDEPGVANVGTGVQYGAGGTEFTGLLVAPPEGGSGLNHSGRLN